MSISALTSSPAAEAQDEAPSGAEVRTAFSYSTGFDYSEGDYGLDRQSRLYYVPLGVTVDHGLWRFRFVLPLLYSDGVEFAALPGGARDRPGSGPVSSRSAGIGDATTTASCLLEPFAEGTPWIELAGQIAWPTRTDEDLGTGAFAFATQADFFRSFDLDLDLDWGRLRGITPYATFGRNYYLAGSLRDRFYASIGISFELSRRLSAGVSYDWLGATDREQSNGSEIAPYLSYQLNEAWRVGPYAAFGLTKGSPDYGVGLSIRFSP